mmetsp:Transcript_11564/g.26895  ORF Transcript_11564/g.26895 Transcript_11564/m.26895 type:complete len:344 (-) Transcript_11564:83-1114(-)
MKRLAIALSAAAAANALVAPNPNQPTLALIGNGKLTAHGEGDDVVASLLPDVATAMGPARFQQTSRMAVDLSSAADALQMQMKSFVQDETHSLAALRADLEAKLASEENATQALALKNAALSEEIRLLKASTAEARKAMDSASSWMSGDSSENGESSDSDGSDQSADSADSENAAEKAEDAEAGSVQDDEEEDDDGAEDASPEEAPVPLSFLATGESIAVSSGTEAGAVTSLLADNLLRGQTSGAGALRGHRSKEQEKQMLQVARQLTAGIAQVIAAKQDTEKVLQDEFQKLFAKLQERKAALQKENTRLVAEKAELVATHSKLTKFMQQVAKSLKTASPVTA